MSADVRSSPDVRSPVREFDIQNYYHTEQDPLEAFLEYRETEPFWCESVNSFWAFSRYDECRDIMQDSSLFSRVGAGVPPMELAARRQSPRDDMLSGIVHSQIDGETIDADVAINLASTVFLGGLDTLPHGGSVFAIEHLPLEWDI